MAFIQKQALQNYWDTVRPSGLDVAYCVAVTTFLLVVLMLPTIFGQYNTYGTSEVLRSGAGSVLGKFLLRIDQLSFTNNIVTFLLWGVVGMVVYGLISSVIRALAKAEQERELASDEYVHPAAFSRAKFWHEELLISGTTIVSAAICLVVFVFVALKLLPMTTVHLRSVITSGGQNIWSAVASIVLLIIGAVFVMLGYKIWRHRMVLFEEA